jgi:hypothetical protein
VATSLDAEPRSGIVSGVQRVAHDPAVAVEFYDDRAPRFHEVERA